MFLWVASFLLLISTAMAEVGKISKIIGTGDAYILRSSSKMNVAQDALLEEGDEIFTQDSVVVVHLYPQSQLSLSKNTHVKLSKSVIDESTETEKAFSIIDYVKGIIRLQVTKDPNQAIEQKVQADGVAFAVRGTEFEISQEGDDVDLDVVEGEVEVSSPHVQTFVPEIVKANEGFRFNKRARNFQRRKFKMRLKETGFTSRAEVREQWKKKRQELKLKKQMKLQTRQQNKAERFQKMRMKKERNKNR